MPEYIYQMRAVRKAHGDKVILNNVTLAFLPGAKIGVVGPNGMGKSTLLRMMAGVEQPSNGDARLMPGFTVGMLDQEPQLDETKTVLGNVEDGVAETKKLLAAYNEVAEKMAIDDLAHDCRRQVVGGAGFEQAGIDAGAGERHVERQRPVDRFGDKAAVEAAGDADMAFDTRLQAEAEQLRVALADEAHRLDREIEADFLAGHEIAGREDFLEGGDGAVRLVPAHAGVDQQGNQRVAWLDLDDLRERQHPATGELQRRGAGIRPAMGGGAEIGTGLAQGMQIGGVHARRHMPAIPDRAREAGRDERGAGFRDDSADMLGDFKISRRQFLCPFQDCLGRSRDP